MPSKLLTAHRRRSAASGTISGAPVSQVAATVRDDLNIVGTVSSGSPIEWVYSQDGGTTWTVFDPAGKVRDLVWKVGFFDTFTSAPTLPNWEVFSGAGHLGNGIWSTAQTTVSSGNLVLTGATDVSNGVKTGGLLLKRENTFGKFRVQMRADLDPSLTFRAVAYAKSYDNANFVAPIPGGEIDFSEMLASTADTRLVRSVVHGNTDGATDIGTTINYPGDNGENFVEYTCERSPGRVDYYLDGAYAGSVVDSGSTPVPKGPMHLAMQFAAHNPTYGGAALKMEVGYAEVSDLVNIPIQVRARLVSNTSVVSPTATVTLAGASSQIVFTTDLPATSTRAAGAMTSLTATWNQAAAFQVQERTNSGGTWVNSSGTGANGFGTTTTYGASVAAVDDKQYRVKVTSGGYYYYSTVTTMDVAAPTNPTSDIRGWYLGLTTATSFTIAHTDFVNPAGTPVSLVAGDAILFLATAAGPSDSASVTFTHNGLGQIFNAPGATYNPRLRIAMVSYDGTAQSWTFSADVFIRVAAIALKDTACVLLSPSPTSGLTPTDPVAVTANPDYSLGLAVTAVNFSGGSVQNPPDGHQTLFNSGIGTRQLYVAKKSLMAGVYDPGPASVGPGTENATSVAIVACPSVVAGGWVPVTGDITLVGVNYFSYVGTNTASISVPLPVEDIQEDDLIEIYVSTQESTTAAQPNTPSGYTLAYDGGAVGSFLPRITKFYKWAVGNEESTSVTVTWPSGTPRPHAVSQVWRNVDKSAYNDGVTQSQVTGTANPNPPSRTTVTNRALVKVTCVGNKTPAVASTISTGYTTTIDRDADVRGFSNCHKKIQTAGTAEDPAAYVWAVDNSTAVTEVLRRASVKATSTSSGGSSGGVTAPTVPTFDSVNAITINTGDNVASVVAASLPGKTFVFVNGTYNNCSDVRPKTGQSFWGPASGLATFNGSGKAYCFRAGANGSSDNVFIGRNMKIMNYGLGTTRAEYGAVQAQPTDTVGGEYTYGHANNWFVYGVTFEKNSSSGIRVSDNCTVYQCTIYGHSVTGIGGDRIVGGKIYGNTIEANALNPATGVGSNGAQIKLTWVNADEGRTAIIPSAYQRAKAVCQIANNTLNATRSGITGSTAIGVWFDLDCQNTEVIGNTITGHSTTSIFWEGSNGGLAKSNIISNSNGFGPANGSGSDFMNGALACGESTNITFDSNTVTNCTYALVNRMSNRSSDWYKPTPSPDDYVNFAWASGPRYWITAGNPTPVPTTSQRSNMWTGNNVFRNNTLVSCGKVVINEGVNAGGHNVVNSTPLSTIQFIGNNYSGSPGIVFHHLSTTGISLSAWQALSYQRDN